MIIHPKVQWMYEIHFATPKKPWSKPLFATVWTKGIIIPGFLRWCEMDCVHPQYERNLLGGGWGHTRRFVVQVEIQRPVPTFETLTPKTWNTSTDPPGHIPGFPKVNRGPCSPQAAENQCQLSVVQIRSGSPNILSVRLKS